MKFTHIIISLFLSVGLIKAQVAPLPIPYDATVPVSYVRVWTPQQKTQETSELNVLNNIDKAIITTQYLDGLGRNVQTVVKNGSLQTNDQQSADLVTANSFDQYGRTPLQYLPFVANTAGGNAAVNNGYFKRNPFEQQASFSTNQYVGETYFYAKTIWEDNPLNRVIKNTAPGMWTGLNKSTQAKFYFNTEIDAVKIWDVTESNIDNFGIYSSIKNYDAGLLDKTITIDEHNKQVIEFKDFEGKVILKKVQLTAENDNGSGAGYEGWLCTYYIYDIQNNLRAVLQPEGLKAILGGINAMDDNLLKEQFFRYQYDQRNRMIRKQVPGAGPVCMVYDNRDRLVMTQDANLRLQHKWIVTLYDVQNRVIGTSKIVDDAHYNDLNYHLTAAYNSVQYPNVANYASEELTVNYYDDYEWIASSGLPNTLINFDITQATPILNLGTQPGGLPLEKVPVNRNAITGVKTQVLNMGTPTYLNAISYFDDKGRVIQTRGNHLSNGIVVQTQQYDWLGKQLVSVQKIEKNTTAIETLTHATQTIYDVLNRPIQQDDIIGGSLVNNGVIPQTWHTTTTLHYDKIGQLVNKKLAPNYGQNGLENLQYQYNIRGWLSSVNQDYTKGLNNSHYFGFNLGYNQLTNITEAEAVTVTPTPQYNGNIGDMQWRSKGDGIRRLYNFKYDAVNRLIYADFLQKDNGIFSKESGVDFSVSNLAYDDNGNILTMQQKGLKINSSSFIDQLNYTYFANSNKLKAVVDAANDNTSKLGDFKYDVSTKTAVDYSYDINGNMQSDANKNIQSISYNYLNLPELITIPNKGTIRYVYDALGNKLRKTVTDNTITPTKTTVTDYIGGLVYENNALQFAPQQEGRIRFKPQQGTQAATFVYDYMLKDHLGNVRMVLTEEQQVDHYPTATLEGNGANSPLVNEQAYYDINSAYVEEIQPAGNHYINDNGTNNPQTFGNNGATSIKMYKTNAATNKTGLGMVLKVMAGDQLSLLAKSYYQYNGGTVNNAPLDATALITGFLGVGGSSNTAYAHGATTTILSNNTSGTVAPLNSFINSNSPNSSNNVKAGIAYIIFDEQFKYVNSGYDAVSSNTAGGLKSHVMPNIPIPKNGYIYFYCSNESNINVYFDNMEVIHNRGAILEETHYYPFGLTMSGISSKAATSLENKYKFNGIEQENDFGLNYYEAFYRTADPQIGRFLQVDPVSTHDESPYVMMGNNPIRNTDWLGNYFTFANSTVENTYNDMRKENTQRSYDALSKILSLAQSGEKMDKEMESLVSQFNTYSQMDSQWDEMEKSDVEFNISSESPEKGAAADTRYDADKNRIAIRMGKNEKNISHMAHEIRHGYGYLIGELVGSRSNDPLYDIMDEVVANKNGFALSNKAATSMLFNKKVNLDWFKQNQLNPTYSYLSGKEAQLTLNTPAAVFLNYTNDTYIKSYITRNLANVNLTVGDVLKAVNALDAKANPPRPATYVFGDALKNR
ncbi:DUF6443 domain-containing protein [Ferruginibacter yonginensis]|uniref:DUF6443 domain-containing protein n=1 Tax=Ferruginibacter yonginensis TaxID=1310416 RepID=A0ABV8QR99_9BACT